MLTLVLSVGTVFAIGAVAGIIVSIASLVTVAMIAQRRKVDKGE
jgi:TRAP-type C4-dicarboxylate transport system permease large subunit